MKTKYRVGLLTAPYSSTARTVREHIESISEFSKHKISILVISGEKIEFDLDKFDALILHYSLIAFPAGSEKPLSYFAMLQIANFKGPVVAFAQDEQRAVLDRIRFLNGINVKHLFTCVEAKNLEILYPSKTCNFTTTTVLTGYTTTEHESSIYSELPKLSDRKIDVSYRGRIMPEWMGSNGVMKERISKALNYQAEIHPHLKIDSSVNEQKRLYGVKWRQFLLDTKVAVATPSGSSAADLYGKYIEVWANSLLNEGREFPDPIPLDLGVISPRIFEYAASGCLIAITPGQYSGMMIPNFNCVTLNLDASNLKEIIDIAHSSKGESIVRSAFESLILSKHYHYRTMVNELDSVLNSYLIHEPLEIVHEINSVDIEKSKFIFHLKLFIFRLPSFLIAPILRLHKSTFMFITTLSNLRYLMKFLKMCLKFRIDFIHALFSGMYSDFVFIQKLQRYRKEAEIRLVKSATYVGILIIPNQVQDLKIDLLDTYKMNEGAFVKFHLFNTTLRQKELLSFSKYLRKVGIDKPSIILSTIIGDL